MERERAQLESFYRSYLRRCNEHRFATLGAFVAEDVDVNGERRGLPAYIGGLSAVVETFPDFHWDLRQLLVDGSWLTARLLDTGTTPAGRAVTTREFAIYRVAGDRIVEVWGDLDHEKLVQDCSADRAPR